MSACERVVFAFERGGEGVQSVQLAIRAKRFAPSGKYLMSVSLMSHVPHKSVFGRVEDVVQCDGNLNDAERRGKVAGIDRHLFDDVVAQFLAHLWQLFDTEFPQVGGCFYLA